MWGLGILLAANVLLLATVFFQVWQEFAKPQVMFVQTARDLEPIFGMYKDRVDNLQKTITALVGLSSLYSIVLGFTAYFSVQQYLAQFGKAIKDAKKQTEELRRQTPILRGIDQSISNTIDLIAQRLPDDDYVVVKYAKLTDDQREELLYYERSIGFLEFLKLGPKQAKTLSNLYRKLGKLCRARYEWTKTPPTVADPKTQGVSASQASKPEDSDLHSLIDRAKLYANRSLEHNPDNFGTLTDLAVYWDLSAGGQGDEPFQKIRESLRIQPVQQRAHYQRGLFLLKRGRSAERRNRAEAVNLYKDCVQACSDALGQSVWEIAPLPAGRLDLLYNRACARSRHASLEVDPKSKNDLGQLAWLDLLEACPGPDESNLKILDEDLDDQTDGDLVWLRLRQPAAIDALRLRLNGQTLPVEIAVIWN